jgi:3-phosphoshikimate 1-carboxyvinyltransferase
MSVLPAAPPTVLAQAARLRGELRMPPDKSITHRALLLAAVAEGESRIHDGSDALDPGSTAACLRALGVTVEGVAPPATSETADGRPCSGRVDWLVRSPGWTAWRAPEAPLECANSGTTLRLLAGLLAGSELSAVLDGDASLRTRPVRRIVEPLRAMGASVSAADGDMRPPLSVRGRRPLAAIDWTTAVPSAQVKSAILLAGLAAKGRTTVREAVGTRDHTERMLQERGVPVEARPAPGGSWAVSLEGPATVLPADETVPGDVSAATFWLVAGAAHPDAELTLRGVGVNPTRRAAVDLLRAMGAAIEERPLRGGGEPRADLVVRTSALEAIELWPADVARAIDEIPALALAAACARGTSRMRGAGELRHKESDRLVGIVEGLSVLGARAELQGDDLLIEGGAGRSAYGLRGTLVASHADHRLAMAFAIAGLIAAGRTTLDGAGSAAVSYPAFFDDLERVRA